MKRLRPEVQSRKFAIVGRKLIGLWMFSLNYFAWFVEVFLTIFVTENVNRDLIIYNAQSKQTYPTLSVQYLFHNPEHQAPHWMPYKTNTPHFHLLRNIKNFSNRIYSM